MVFFHFFHFRMVYKGKTKTHEARAIALQNIQAENEVFLIFTGFLIYNDDIYQFISLEYLCGILLFTFYLFVLTDKDPTGKQQVFMCKSYVLLILKRHSHDL